MFVGAVVATLPAPTHANASGLMLMASAALVKAARFAIAVITLKS